MKYWPFLVLAFLVVCVCPALAADTYMGFVTGKNSNNLAVFDPSSNAVLTTLNVGSGPVGVAVNPSGTLLYNANGFAQTIPVYSVNDYTLKYTIPVSYPTAIAINPSGTRAYISSYTNAKVYVLDLTTNTLIGNGIDVGAGAYGIVYSRYNDRVYVANLGANSVSVINPSTLTVTNTINVGASPAFITALTVKNEVYVTCGGNNSVDIISQDTNTKTGSIALGAIPQGVVSKSTDDYVYVATSAGVKVVSTSSHTVTSTITAYNVLALAIMPDDTSLYMTNATNSYIHVVDLNTGTIKADINTSLAYMQFMVIAKVAQESSNLAPMQVTFNVNKGGIVNVNDANVSIYDANTGMFISNDMTDDAGNSVFWLIPGKRYTVKAITSDMSIVLSVQVQPNDQYYYLDVCTGEIYGSYQYTNLYRLHYCMLYVYNWFTPENNVTLELYKNETLIKRDNTDNRGSVTFYVQSDVKYRIEVKNSTKNIDNNFTEYLNGDQKRLDLYIINIGDWDYNESQLNQSGPQSIYVSGNVTKRTSGGSSYIDCNYTDTGLKTTAVTYTLYVSENGAQTQLATDMNAGTFGTDTHTFTVTSPDGKDYTVKIEAAQTGGNTTLWFNYHWPGARVNIPGFPVDWYKYLSLLLIGGVALGTASRLNVSLVAASMTISALFMYSVLGWLFEIPAAPVLIFFMIVISVVMFMGQKARGEI